jgi:hypothetical protein
MQERLWKQFLGGTGQASSARDKPKEPR